MALSGKSVARAERQLFGDEPYYGPPSDFGYRYRQDFPLRDDRNYYQRASERADQQQKHPPPPSYDYRLSLAP